MSEETDATLMAEAATGSREAFARIYDRYAGILLAIALRILRDRREAEDLLHDVLLDAWRVATEYDPERGSVRAWLTMRMRSRALDRAKSARFSRSDSLDGPELPDAGAADFTLEADRAVVQRALAELPQDQRVVLELGFWRGLSSSEIAAEVGAPVGTVKSRIAAALRKLRETLLVGTHEEEVS